jgi:hypothetical protein
MLLHSTIDILEPARCAAFMLTFMFLYFTRFRGVNINILRISATLLDWKRGWDGLGRYGVAFKSLQSWRGKEARNTQMRVR